MSIRYVGWAVWLLAASGAPGLLWRRKPAAGQMIATTMMVAGAAVGLLGAASVLIGGQVEKLLLPWPVMAAGVVQIKLDPLGAFFLAPVFLMAALGSIYGLGYWPASRHSGHAAKLQFYYGLLPASMAIVVLAADGVLFITAWEIMALTAYFLITIEEENAAAQRAGWIYLVATHLGTLCLLAMFVLLRGLHGSFALDFLREAKDPVVLTVIFLLALAGFGLKAGLMPLHVWLPGAHGSAPSHVSALLSGVMLKMGIYGLFRILTLLPTPPLWWGELVLALGAVSAVTGVLFALGQHDLKRLLAYHSIENIGIILMGVGLFLVGASAGAKEVALLGLAGGLLHVWNHALFKSLLFFGAGNVIHGGHTQMIDRLGGLAKLMPWTAALFLAGAVAICGLPPLNGFISEFLIYVGLFKAILPGGYAPLALTALAAPALALTGALATACFVKVFGIVFLGEARTEPARRAEEAAPAMLLAMLVLTVGCFAIGLLPFVLIPVLANLACGWPALSLGNGAADSLSLLWVIGPLQAVLLGVIVAVVLAVKWWLKNKPIRRAPTWDCGYAVASPRIQYTASSFAQMLVDWFAWVLRPHTEPPRLGGIFAPPAEFHQAIPDVILDLLTLPLLRTAGRALPYIRRFHQGRLHAYLLYIMLTLLVLLFVV